MDTEIRNQHEELNSEATAANDIHITTTTDEGTKANNGAVADIEKQAVPRRSAFALINRRIRLFFRPWKWRRKNRSKNAKDAALKGLYRGEANRLFLSTTIHHGETLYGTRSVNFSNRQPIFP